MLTHFIETDCIVEIALSEAKNPKYSSTGRPKKPWERVNDNVYELFYGASAIKT